MQNLTIKLRILMLGLLAVGGLVISGGIGIYQLSHFNAQLEEDLADVRSGVLTLVEIQSASIDFKTQVQEWKNILIRGNNGDEFAKYQKAFSEKASAVQGRLRKALDILKNENDPEKAGAIAELEKLLKDHAGLGVAYQAALEKYDKADPEAGKKIDVAVKGQDRAATDGMNKLVAKLEEGELTHLKKQVEVAREIYARSRNQILGLMVLGLLLAGGIVVVTIRQISGQIFLVQEASAEIRQTLNLTHRIPVSGNHEIANVATSINALLDEFQGVVRRMKEAGVRVSGASDNLAHSVTQLSSAVSQQNEATSSMAASMEEMAVSVTHVSDSSTMAKDIAYGSLASADEGKVVVDQTAHEMEEMAASVQATSNAMESLSKRTEEIGSIVGVIKEIADQTNLLALNAAIEAARAGEQGRGFAVVADEVRKLAERTTSSTKEVGDVISTIQIETRNAVDDMHKIVEQVTAGAESARQAGASIIQIREGSSRVVSVSSEIDSALKEQSSASELIAKQVELIASMSDENTSAMNEAKDASEKMKRLATEMHDMVDRFRV